MRINYNISSIIAGNCLNNNDLNLSASTERLSSGYKINSAADDAAGMAISLKMKAQLRALAQADDNANDGISVVNTADGAMSEMHDILQRLNELSIQAANGTNSDSDREQIQLEVDELIEELDRIAETTQFNSQNLLDGSFAYKGYTNTENIKVMSYGDGVTSGTYAITGLTYYHDEDKIQDKAAYIEESSEGETTHEETYFAASADDIRDALICDTTTIEGTKAFPEGCKVILDENEITIKGEGDFELKLSLNDNDAVEDSGATTKKEEESYTTDYFRNVVVKSADGDRYNITEVYAITNKTTGDDTVYSSSSEIGYPSYTSLTTDFADAFTDKFGDNTIKVTGCDYDSATHTFSITAEPVDSSTGLGSVTKEFTVAIETPNDWDESTKGSYIANGITEKEQSDYLNYYLNTHTETTRTKYTIGDTGTKESNNILLDLTGMGAMRLQVGANEGQVIAVEIPALQTIYMGLDGLDMTTEDKATAAIDKIGDAINQLSCIRAKIGAYSNRIEHTISNLNTSQEEMTAAYSRIMDTDMAEEMTNYTTIQVLVQSSTSMLAQANENSQQVLQLLQ